MSKGPTKEELREGLRESQRAAAAGQAPDIDPRIGAALLKLSPKQIKDLLKED